MYINLFVQASGRFQHCCSAEKVLLDTVASVSFDFDQVVLSENQKIILMESEVKHGQAMIELCQTVNRQSNVIIILKHVNQVSNLFGNRTDCSVTSKYFSTLVRSSVSFALFVYGQNINPNNQLGGKCSHILIFSGSILKVSILT